MAFFKLLYAALTNVIIFFYIVCNLFFEKTVKAIRKENYTNVYWVYGISLVLISTFLKDRNSLITFIFKLFVIVIMISIMGYIHIHLRRSKSDVEKRFYNFMCWWLASTYFLLPISNLFEEFNNISSYFILITLFMFTYYGMRYALYKWLLCWWIYSIVFFVMPIITALLWSVFSIILTEITNNSIFMSDYLLGWMVLVLSIFLTNLVIYFTPSTRIDEVKVAIYFLLAFFSTISYCFFISDYLANWLFPYFQVQFSISFTKEDIKEFIKAIITWGTLPYLIGSVFGCFTIELRSRNINRKAVRK